MPDSYQKTENYRCLWVFLILMYMAPATSSVYADNSASSEKAEDLLRKIINLHCKQEDFPDILHNTFTLLESEPIKPRGKITGQRYIFDIPPTRKIQLEVISTGNHPKNYRFTIFKETDEPELFAIVNSYCKIQLVRKILYGKNHATALLHLSENLDIVTKTEPINPKVPKAGHFEGIRVGIVDSGVNYLLPGIYKRLARTDNKIIGYDYWDMDSRPFDSNPARSGFFPQRHGTKTASILLREAPHASLVPYRYPRPDMARITQLIDHAASNQVRIIALPLGSTNREEWLPFYEAASNHPEILFIVSSGNNGIDIDKYPIYPAAFLLDNQITVSAADETPVPASRTNWGKNSVDILLPADRQKTIDFNGREREVSGTSYAVSRIAALATRIALQHTDWDTKKIKQHIISMADPTYGTEYTRYGLMNDPLRDTASIQLLSKQVFSNKILSGDIKGLNINIILLEKSGWTLTRTRDAIAQAQEIYRQCNIGLSFTLYHYKVPDYMLDFHSLSAKTLIDMAGHDGLNVFMVRDTRRLEAFGGEAFGKRNTRRMPWLENTSWLISGQRDNGIILAHEIFHILTDSGAHTKQPGNLMNANTHPDNIHLSSDQCKLLHHSMLLTTTTISNESTFPE